MPGGLLPDYADAGRAGDATTVVEVPTTGVDTDTRCLECAQLPGSAGETTRLDDAERVDGRLATPPIGGTLEKSLLPLCEDRTCPCCSTDARSRSQSAVMAEP